MKTRTFNGVPVQRGSGNVYADLGLPDADKLKIKTGLVIEIRKAMGNLGLTHKKLPNAKASLSPKCQT